MLLKRTGFFVDQVILTFFQNPGKVDHIEPPQRGFSQSAGFTVILASKPECRR